MWNCGQAYQLSGAAKHAVHDAGHKGAVETPHGGQTRQLGVGHALRYNHGRHRKPSGQVRLRAKPMYSQHLAKDTRLPGSWRTLASITTLATITEAHEIRAVHPRRRAQ